MKKISILGANGNIGQTLTRGLKNNYDLKPFDIKPNKGLGIDKLDVLKMNELTKNILNSDVVINLAWDIKSEAHHLNNYDEKNFKMSENIFRACIEANVPRLIVASSVRCHNIEYLVNANYTNYINIRTPTNPSSFYGKDKVKIENLGKVYSRFFDVICVRFGAIEKQDMSFWKTKLGVTHSDCIGLIEHIIKLEEIENKFQKIYGLSKYDNSVFNLKNNLNWKPKDDLTEFYNRHQNFNVR